MKIENRCGNRKIGNRGLTLINNCFLSYIALKNLVFLSYNALFRVKNNIDLRHADFFLLPSAKPFISTFNPFFQGDFCCPAKFTKM